MVRLLDRTSPVSDVHHTTDQELADTLAQDSAEVKSNAEDSDTAGETPLNPTPPRTRRGSWIFKKSRERHSKSKGGASATPKQRARSNSVPAVMDLTHL